MPGINDKSQTKANLRCIKNLSADFILNFSHKVMKTLINKQAARLKNVGRIGGIYNRFH